MHLRVGDLDSYGTKLNPVLRGWGNYFRTGTCRWECHKMNDFVFARLVRWLYRCGGQRRTRQALWTSAQFRGMGLYRLRGTMPL